MSWKCQQCGYPNPDHQTVCFGCKKSRPALCTVCRQKPCMYHCPKCGRLVCETCAAGGVCSVCYGTAQARREMPQRPPHADGAYRRRVGLGLLGLLLLLSLLSVLTNTVNEDQPVTSAPEVEAVPVAPPPRESYVHVITPPVPPPKRPPSDFSDDDMELIYLLSLEPRFATPPYAPAYRPEPLRPAPSRGYVLTAPPHRESAPAYQAPGDLTTVR